MTSLYSLTSTLQPGEYIIRKFDADYNLDSLYALSEATCLCPQGHKPTCRHRKMLAMFLEHKHVDDGWFLDWDTRLWRHPVDDIASEASSLPSRSDDIHLADTTILTKAAAVEPEYPEAPVTALPAPPKGPSGPSQPQIEAASVEGAASLEGGGPEQSTLAACHVSSPSASRRGEPLPVIKRRKITS